MYDVFSVCPYKSLAVVNHDLPQTSFRNSVRRIRRHRFYFCSKPKGFINARAETLEQKPSFSESFQRRRCLIPADGFFEWARAGRSKQPYYFQMKDESPFAFAGIWDRWQRNDRIITSCSIITTTPNELLATIHDRMPVILTADGYDAWLRDDADPRELKELLAPYPAASMKSFPVSARVNSALVDEPALVEPVEGKPEMTTGILF
jgi:putative SOS response-associated peptidase YedK